MTDDAKHDEMSLKYNWFYVKAFAYYISQWIADYKKHQIDHQVKLSEI